MLWKTYEVFRNRLDYTKNADGSWRAELSGGLQIRVVGSSLERCRWKAIDAFDEQVAAIVIGPPTEAHGMQTATETGKTLWRGTKTQTAVPKGVGAS